MIIAILLIHTIAIIILFVILFSFDKRELEWDDRDDTELFY